MPTAAATAKTGAVRDAGGDVVDVAFRLAGGRLPVDHAFALSTAVGDALPWFARESDARLHQVHTAAAGSGWMRPEGAPGELLHLSRRTRLILRLPAQRAGDARALEGRRLDVDGYRLEPGAAKVVPLVAADTLLARHVVCGENEEEARLVARLGQALGALDIEQGQVICGRAHRIATPDGVLHTRSVVVTGLDDAGAMALMRRGLGPAGKLGCGVFVPYKRIA